MSRDAGHNGGRIGPGAVLAGRYRLIDQVGLGVTSLVYRATDQQTDGVVAVKVLRQPSQRSSETYKRFLREGRLLRRLRHPNIVRFLDFGPTESSVFIVTEYLTGEDLSAVLDRRGALDLGASLSLLMQICLALEAAHQMDVLHRDLKPANLRLVPRADGFVQVKVLDFGLAKPLIDGEADMIETVTGQVLGTPNYIAPEVIRALNVDSRADIYSTGALAYRLVTGRPVFRHKVPTRVLLAHLKDQPVPPSLRAPERHLPVALDKLVLQALAKRPADRPGRARQLYRMFRAIAKSI